MKIILGIDPGSCITGFGVIKSDGNRYHYVTSGCVRITEKKLSLRLQQIFDGLCQIIFQYQPQEAAIEQIFMHQNPGSALKLGQARGVAIVAAATHVVPVAEYSARQVKQSVVGYGAATKMQVKHMIKTLLNLSDFPQSDASDALAVAICHANSNQVLKLSCRSKRRGKRG